MPINCREVCDIADLRTCSDERLLEISDLYFAGKIHADEEWLRVFGKQTSVRHLELTFPDVRIGQLSFEVTEADAKLINQKSLDPWVRPDCTRSDFSYILGYAQSFAGYEFAEAGEFDLGILANERLDQFKATGNWKGTFVELRCCLFYEIRRQRHLGLYESHWREIQSLFKAVCSAHNAETPPRC